MFYFPTGDAGIKNLKYCLFLVISEAPTDTQRQGSTVPLGVL